VNVLRTERLTPRLVRVTLGGAELRGLEVAQPAASVRVLVPRPDAAGLEVPEWTGNEFRLPDGTRPVIRTLTPRRVDSGALELIVDVVIHGRGAAAEWAAAAHPGDPAAVSGPARGYRVDPDGDDFLLAGDETALPAICQILEWMPLGKSVRVAIEIAVPTARIALPAYQGASVTWFDLPPGAAPGAGLELGVRQADLAPDGRWWVAGEAAAVQRVRRFLFEERGLSPREATVRGYWKHGRSAASGEVST
jgi:NADPH-dependent ferric siderophore reductase